MLHGHNTSSKAINASQRGVQSYCISITFRFTTKVIDHGHHNHCSPSSLLHAPPALLAAALLPPALAAGGVSPHRALLQSCKPSGSITGKSGSCNTDHGSECCEDGRRYTTFACSPPVTASTGATLTLNSFADGGDGGGASSCTGTFFDDDEKVVALSTGWFDGRSRCKKSIVIEASNGKSVTAMVVDECDSQHGCDDDHNFSPPCRNNIVDGSPAVWEALGLNTDDGQVPITWSDA